MKVNREETMADPYIERPKRANQRHYESAELSLAVETCLE